MMNKTKKRKKKCEDKNANRNKMQRKKNALRGAGEMQVRAAEASCTSTRSLVGINSAASLRTPPPLAVQLDALLRRAALNVGRDPYLAWLHVLLTVCVGLVVGSLFRDLGRLNEVTAGVQVSG